LSTNSFGLNAEELPRPGLLMARAIEAPRRPLPLTASPVGDGEPPLSATRLMDHARGDLLAELKEGRERMKAAAPLLESA
jgi:hypothetical protein